MKVYRGTVPSTGSWDHAVVEVVDDVTGRSDPLTHHVKHSPSGFSWGYGGSGPADLARSILIDHLGGRGKCETCAGTGRVTREQTPRPPSSDVPVDVAYTYCPECGGEGTSFPPALYHRFKFDRVAKWPEHGWQITAAEIDEWLAFDQVRVAAEGAL